uniref:Retrotransposon protein, putative, Ty1-copia subclass n=1 Tax=Tanacetum cinerariifolium TaxID=118510 RepID=A0A699HB86_TANCI|nr:retrotransposon protein, putative, Ty1-copia subclass [Tanacetum cinerariifolium]
MVAYLEKSDDNTKFHQIVDFLCSCSINYALTISPTIYASYIEQFYNIASSKTINYEKNIHAIVDGKAVVISESSVRSDLLFDDEDAPEGEGSTIPPEPQPTPSTSQPTTAEPQSVAPLIKAHLEPILQYLTVYQRQRKTQKDKRTQKETELPQTSVPLHLRADEAVHQEGLTVWKGGIDTRGNPRRQDTMGGTSALTRSERVLAQPNEPPLMEGHTFGCGDERMEHTIELTDTVPLTPHDSSLTGGYTPGSHEGRLKLEEFIDLCTTLSSKLSTLENELISTKAVYHKAFITLTKRVKKLEIQLKQNRSRAVIHSLYEEEPSVHINDSPKQGRMIEELEKDEDVNLVSQQGDVQEIAESLKDDDDATLAETLLNIKRNTTKDRGKGIMKEIELPKKIKKREMIQLSFDEELAQKLYAEELETETARQEHEKYNLEKYLELQTHLYRREKYVEKGDQAKEIDWNDPTVLRYHALQNRPFSKDKVRKNMVIVWDQVHTFVPKDLEIKKEVMKRSGFHLQQVEEMKLYMRIVPDKDISIDVIPLATKPLVIVEYKIVNEGKISTYHITRADGSTKRYTLMIKWLENIDREDLEALWKLVKDKHRNTRPEDSYERVLYKDLKVMFEPNIESYPKETMSYSFCYPLENKVIVARNVEFFKNSLISQEASKSLEDLEVILEEDAQNYENTSLHHDEDEQEIDKPQSGIISIRRMYVKNAFLNGNLTKEVCMVQPEGFVNPKYPIQVCKLQRFIYGLNKAARQWNKMFDEEIKKFDSTQNSDEPCVYVEYFAMKDLGEAAYIHEIKIYRDRSKLLIGLCQSDYIEKILKRFNMKNSKRGLVPMQKKPRLSKAQGASTLDEVKRT